MTVLIINPPPHLRLTIHNVPAVQYVPLISNQVDIRRQMTAATTLEERARARMMMGLIFLA